MGLPMPKPADVAVAAPAPFTVLPKPEATPAPAAPAVAIKPKLSLSGFKKAKAATEKIHPAAKSDEELQQAVAQFCEIKPRFDADKDTLDQILKPQILGALVPQILSSRGAEFSMLALGPLPDSPGKPQAKLMVTLTRQLLNADFETAMNSLVPIIGEDLFNRYFEQSPELTITVADAEPDQRQQLIEELAELAAKYGVNIAAKDNIKPLDGFHEARRSVFTADQNIAMFAAIPNKCMIKTTNVKS